LVEFAVIRDRLLVWVLTRSQTYSVSRPWKASGVPRALHRLRLEVGAEGDDSDLIANLETLFEGLIRPIRERLTAGDTLVFVPGGDLAAVPFPGLLDRTTHRYLIEEHPLVVSASASLYLRAEEMAQAQAAPRHLLAIADPAFDRHWHSGLEPLPGSLQEASSISSLYDPDAVVLSGAAANPVNVMVRARKTAVLHYAGHTTLDDAVPERSALVLAPANSEPSSGDLAAAQIERASLNGTRLVVLSSCSGSSGRVANGEGVLSLARSFQAAGVATVIASLWPFADDGGPDFFVHFHIAIRRGENLAEALQKIQVMDVSSPNNNRRSPRAWAGIEIFGAARPLF